MASNQNCSICFDTFNQPKILPCFHTFCQECLDKYIRLYAQSNQFDCPICSLSIDVPADGAKNFQDNFYIERRQAQNHFCSRHKTKQIDFYCRDCSIAVCGRCVTLDHKNHTAADLQDADQEVRGKLNIIKGEIETKIYELKKHCECLTNQVTDIKNQAKLACDKVDQQVQKICDEVKKHGGDIKRETNKICDKECKKLLTLHKDMIQFNSHLQSSVKYITDVLNGKSTVPVVDALTNAQTLTDDSRSTSLDIPRVEYVHYPMVDIDVKILQLLLGEIEIMESPTWTSSFSLNQIVKTDVNYRGGDVMIQGMPWYVCVKHQTDTSGLGCYLRLREVEDKTVKSVTADRTVKLLNINNLHIEYRDTGTSYIPGDRGWGWNKFIEWDTLKDVNEGFINNNKTFTVQVSVKINKIDRH